MTLQEYMQTLKGKNVLVLGLGVSNRPLVRLLLAHGIPVTGCDKTPREKLDAEVLELEKLGATLKLGEDYLKDVRADVVFRTPGILPNWPELADLHAQGAQFASEMEAFFAVCPAQIIAVTGSDGKTTTTTLISKLLEHQGDRVWVGGNIGAPLLDRVEEMQPEDKVVVELSSFQLMQMPYSAHIAVVTNLAPNHLDKHKDMAEYVRAKENIYLHQTEKDTLIVNMDNAITNSFADKAVGTVKKFSRQGKPARGVYLLDGMIYRNGTPVLAQSDILLPGIHNVENYMAAIAAVDGMVSDETIRYVAKTFGGVEHRIELVRVKDGVSYYNDSIASSPSRTIAGLRSFASKVILIAGGYDKHIPYDVLGPEIVEHVKILICTGATGAKIKQATLAAPDYQPGQPEILEIDDFYEAIRRTNALSQPGDVVLLSPASAAFDKFKNFMVRGSEFKKTVMEL